MTGKLQEAQEWTALDAVSLAVMLAGHVAVLVAVASGAGCP